MPLYDEDFEDDFFGPDPFDDEFYDDLFDDDPVIEFEVDPDSDIEDVEF